MTDQSMALNPDAVRAILGHLDNSIDILDRHHVRLTISELQIKQMLSTLRQQLLAELTRLESERSQ